MAHFGGGNIRTVTVSSPAAGAEWSVAVPAGKRWRVVAVSFLLTTGAAVANRVVRFAMNDGAGNRMALTACNAVQVASLVWEYLAGPALPSAQENPQGGTGVALMPIPPEMPMVAGGNLSTATVNLQAADQYSQIVLTVEEFPA